MGRAARRKGRGIGPATPAFPGRISGGPTLLATYGPACDRQSNICLPRLNKTCPNSSKWRESLGIRPRRGLIATERTNATARRGMDAEAHQATADRAALGSGWVAASASELIARAPPPRMWMIRGPRLFPIQPRRGSTGRTFPRLSSNARGELLHLFLEATVALTAPRRGKKIYAPPHSPRRSTPNVCDHPVTAERSQL